MPQSSQNKQYFQAARVPGDWHGALWGSNRRMHRQQNSVQAGVQKTLLIGSGIGVIGTLLVLVFILTNGRPVEEKCNILSQPLVYAGRFVEGVAVGVFSVNCPLIINELAPLEIKIVLGGIFQLSIQLGIMINRGIQLMYSYDDNGFLLSNKSSTLFLPCAPLLVLTCGIAFAFFYFKKETPKYLISRGNSEAAKSLISEIYRSDCWREIYLDKEAEFNFEERISENSFFAEFNLDQIKRKALLLGIYVSILQQASGINFFNIYGTSSNHHSAQDPGVWRQDLGVWREYRLLVSSTLQFVGTTFLVVFSFFWRNRFGERKRKLKWGTYIAFLVHLVVTISSLIKYDESGSFYDISCFVLLCVFMVSFGYTLGPVVWLYIPEIMEPSEIQKVVAVNWFFALLSVTFLPLMATVPSSSNGYITSSVVSMCLLLVYILMNERYLIETQNKSSLEITRIINEVKPLTCPNLCNTNQI